MDDEGWECRPIWYMDPDIFPGDYCLPGADHVQPDTDAPVEDIECPWPW